MSDWTDDASEREDEERARAIAARRAQLTKQIALPPRDDCANDCGDPPAPGSNYCSKDCCEMAELRARQLRRSGVK